MSPSDHAPPVEVAVASEKSVEMMLSSSAVPEKIMLVVVNVVFAFGEVTTGASGAVVSAATAEVRRVVFVYFGIFSGCGAGRASPFASTFGLFGVGVICVFFSSPPA